ncbi:MAG: hypothetical protein LBN39_00810 [Planctomycetaceae bacterium]|jgi:anti-sigma factor RsiW|nr:hypothetical protein [Planctomycetaceae bacterium]
MNIIKTDPKLTAFVLGELTGDEAKEIQTAIDTDAELRSEVEAIRQTVAEIETAMRNEPLAAGGLPAVNAGSKQKASRLRLTKYILAASLLVAACCGAFVVKGLMVESNEVAKLVQFHRSPPYAFVDEAEQQKEVVPNAVAGLETATVTSVPAAEMPNGMGSMGGGMAGKPAAALPQEREALPRGTATYAFRAEENAIRDATRKEKIENSFSTGEKGKRQREELPARMVGRASVVGAMAMPESRAKDVQKADYAKIPSII